MILCTYDNLITQKWLYAYCFRSIGIHSIDMWWLKWSANPHDVRIEMSTSFILSLHLSTLWSMKSFLHLECILVLLVFFYVWRRILFGLYSSAERAIFFSIFPSQHSKCPGSWQKYNKMRRNLHSSPMAFKNDEIKIFVAKNKNGNAELFRKNVIWKIINCAKNHIQNSHFYGTF